MIESVAPDELTANIRLSPNSRVGLPELSIVREGDIFVVGDPITARYLTLPEVGVVAIRTLQSGGSIDDAARAAGAFAGEPVDVLDFASVLLSEGLIHSVDGTQIEGHDAAGRRPWIEGIRPELVRPFFSTPAWIVYGCVALYCLAVFLIWPSYWPSFHDFFFTPDPAICVVASLGARMLLASIHEICHWLAARAAGVGARFTLSRRLYYVVFETDLTQLWSLPKGRRYSPLLAGMAFDVLVLAAALSLRLLSSAGILAASHLGLKIAAAIILGQLVVIGWQMMVFLRTDLYAVLITSLGCTNLYRINQLTLKKRVRGLSHLEASELSAANPADLRAVRWFSWVSVLGLLWATYVFCAVFIPTSVISALWMFARLGSVQFASRSFWEALVLGIVLSLDVVLPAVIFVRERNIFRETSVCLHVPFRPRRVD